MRFSPTISSVRTHVYSVTSSKQLAMLPSEFAFFLLLLGCVVVVVIVVFFSIAEKSRNSLLKKDLTM